MFSSRKEQGKLAPTPSSAPESGLPLVLASGTCANSLPWRTTQSGTPPRIRCCVGTGECYADNALPGTCRRKTVIIPYSTDTCLLPSMTWIAHPDAG